MKIELEYPEDEVQLKVIYAPNQVGGPAFRHLPEDHPLRPWSIYVKSLKCPHYYGAHGLGPSPQAAMDDAIRQVREYLAKHPEGQYNVNVSNRDLNIELDLSGLF